MKASAAFVFAVISLSTAFWTKGRQYRYGACIGPPRAGVWQFNNDATQKVCDALAKEKGTRTRTEGFGRGNHKGETSYNLHTDPMAWYGTNQNVKPLFCNWGYYGYDISGPELYKACKKVEQASDSCALNVFNDGPKSHSYKSDGCKLLGNGGPP